MCVTVYKYLVWPKSYTEIYTYWKCNTRISQSVLLNSGYEVKNKVKKFPAVDIDEDKMKKKG